MLKKLFNLHKYNYLFTPLKFKIQPGIYRDGPSIKRYRDITIKQGERILYNSELYLPITKDKISEVYKELLKIFLLYK